MWQNPQETAEMVTFTEEFPNGKPHFLRSVNEIFKTLFICCPVQYIYFTGIQKKCENWILKTGIPNNLR